MSIRTPHHRTDKIRQRQLLKADGWTDRDIQAFAQIFNTDPEQDDEPRFGCAADTEEDQ